jgi:hypothetical protein
MGGKQLIQPIRDKEKVKKEILIGHISGKRQFKIISRLMPILPVFLGYKVIVGKCRCGLHKNFKGLLKMQEYFFISLLFQC